MKITGLIGGEFGNKNSGTARRQRDIDREEERAA